MMKKADCIDIRSTQQKKEQDPEILDPQKVPLSKTVVIKIFLLLEDILRPGFNKMARIRGIPEGAGGQFEQQSYVLSSMNRPYAHCRLVVCKKNSRLVLPYAWCACFFTVMLCASAVGACRLLIVYKPSADGQQPIVQPCHYKKPTAVRHMAVASLARPAVAQVGARPRYYPNKKQRSPMPDFEQTRSPVFTFHFTRSVNTRESDNAPAG